MYRLQSFAVCFLAVIGATVSVSIFTPCKPKDAACQKKSAMAAVPIFLAGLPDMGLPPADPLYIDKAETNDNNFKLSFKDMKVSGITKCQILDFSRNPDESTMTLVAECPLSLSGQYSLNGMVALIPARGNGGFLIETDKTQLAVTVHVKDVEKGGAKHWKITKFDYKYDILGKASINMENLFDGDETSAKPFREALQNSAKEIIKEVGGDIIKQLLAKQVSHVQKMFDYVPISDLELA